MVKQGQIFTLTGKLDRITVKEVRPEYVRISCLGGMDYEVYPNGEIICCNAYKVSGKRKVVSSYLTPYGYRAVSIMFGHRQAKVFVHRLVGMCFVDNPKQLPFINHKDENKSNNCVENLEWCDNTYNVNYSLNRADPTRPQRIAEREVKKRNAKPRKNRKQNMKLTKDKVKAMLPNDLIAIPCEDAGELDSVYQTAFNARKEMEESGKKSNIVLSRSNVTMTVVVRKNK